MGSNNGKITKFMDDVHCFLSIDNQIFCESGSLQCSTREGLL